ncbi:sugar-binding domain-containing protein [Aliifodinibius sp. S!AR15-10]|uniref:sugar-binding domain-containing protein n=1 Tax=Aliifodinibius sp. S!AR15-10 TaxID=2950437 RepID=UPI0028703B1C|nr:sugar-binding domain-containing protein [Aliifodinibius sp. S!AR15-10]
MEHHECILYRRTFTVPNDWAGDRVLLNFGAVDYEAEVFINGEYVGTHQGGYNPFSFDITSELSGSGEQQVTVRVLIPLTTRDFHAVNRA